MHRPEPPSSGHSTGSAGGTLGQLRPVAATAQCHGHPCGRSSPAWPCRRYAHAVSPGAPPPSPHCASRHKAIATTVRPPAPPASAQDQAHAASRSGLLARLPPSSRAGSVRWRPRRTRCSVPVRRQYRRSVPWSFPNDAGDQAPCLSPLRHHQSEGRRPWLLCWRPARYTILAFSAIRRALMMSPVAIACPTGSQQCSAT
jgi:hypothetical protein